MLKSLAALALLTAACASSEPTAVDGPTTTITLGPAVATGNSYRPFGIDANWTGYCPVPRQAATVLTAGSAYQLVNHGDRSIDVIGLPSRAVQETIAAGATGKRNIQYGAVQQSSVTLSFSVAGCTDALGGQALFTIQVNSK